MGTKHYLHFTKYPEDLEKILQHGFVMTHNIRGLVNLFPKHSFRMGEPENFGALSFTFSPLGETLLIREGNKKRRGFGNFGIAVSEEWITRNQARQVFYLRKFTWTWLKYKIFFWAAYHDLKNKIPYPDDTFSNLSFENMNISGVYGASHYCLALEIYRYMETAKHSYQREWRICNRYPVYTDANNANIIESVNSQQGWAPDLHSIKIDVADILFFCCLPQYRADLEGIIPNKFKSIPIKYY